MKYDPLQLLLVINRYFDQNELQILCTSIDLDFNSLPEGGLTVKARELVSLLGRRKQLEKLVEAIRLQKPKAYEKISVLENYIEDDENVEIDGLKIELASLRKQLVNLQIDLQKKPYEDEELDRKIKEVVKTANRAVGRSEEIKARVILPQQQDMDVHLVPSHSLERLEEYRSDENVAYLLLGIFGGSILGILSNWITNENLVITRVSIVMMCVFAILTALCVFWEWRIHRRANLVKQRLLSNDSQTNSGISGAMVSSSRRRT